MKADFSVWTTYLYVLRSESCKISYFSANLVMHLKMFCIYPEFSFFSWKSCSGYLIYHTAQLEVVVFVISGNFSFIFHISHCFLQGFRLLLHKGYRLSLHKKTLPESVICYIQKTIYRYPMSFSGSVLLPKATVSSHCPGNSSLKGERCRSSICLQTEWMQ